MVKLYAHWRPTADTVVKRRGDASMIRTFVMRRISALVLLAAPHFLFAPPYGVIVGRCEQLRNAIVYRPLFRKLN